MLIIDDVEFDEIIKPIEHVKYTKSEYLQWGMLLVTQNLIFLDNLYVYMYIGVIYFLVDLFTLLYFLKPFIFAT